MKPELEFIETDGDTFVRYPKTRLIFKSGECTGKVMRLNTNILMCGCDNIWFESEADLNDVMKQIDMAYDLNFKSVEIDKECSIYANSV